uniref:Uncharacterized protein n=1 Tax=Chromera velia CCMP2878 TaxID=1169474 RepID=A0A0G4FRK2_9ALVE|eukprot:Cvel_18417.t1-p1 / transcript=Cvel_18417.t1 / gene=Cvel_18417 / organism=Chromera_velia_CCMP2878 / gene_product=hypothetical protein / transcript_product=hypothetical protein / location=Cvel_scaffold1523:37726-38454(+) / protein_length=243 / sequence_SO=supercontig / SO=protein_coding / is_pseudo=false
MDADVTPSLSSKKSCCHPKGTSRRTKRGETYAASEDDGIFDLLEDCVASAELSRFDAEKIRSSIRLCRLFSLEPHSTIPWEIHFNSDQRLLSWSGGGAFRVETQCVSGPHSEGPAGEKGMTIVEDESRAHKQTQSEEAEGRVSEGEEKRKRPEDPRWHVDRVNKGDWHVEPKNTFHHPVNDSASVWSTVTFHQASSEDIRETLIDDDPRFAFELRGDSVPSLLLHNPSSSRLQVFPKDAVPVE